MTSREGSSYTRLLVLPRLWIKVALCRLHLAGRMIEFCKDCGKRQPLVWWADDALWEQLAGTKGILCPKCFDLRAERQGLMLQWTPRVLHKLRRRNE